MNEPADTTDTTTAEEGTSSNLEELPPADIQQTDTPDEEVDPTDAETFPREVVEKLRQENGHYRQRAQAADELAHRLHTELVRATGRLADPSDLDYAEEHLDDPDTLANAIDELLERKPHLATRKPAGDVGQGPRGAASEPFSLLGLLKERT